MTMAAKKTPSPNVIQFPAAAQTEKKKPRKKNLRADGRFCVRVTVKENGKSKQIPFYSTISRADAKAKAQEFKERMGFGLKIEDRNITVKDWASRWIEANKKGKSYGRIENYHTSERFVNARIGEKPVRAVTQLDLVSLMGDLDGYSTSYIGKIHWFVCTIFKDAYINHIIGFDPSIGLKKPEGTYTGHRSLEPWEIDLILNHWRGRRAGIWMMAMLFCGIRRSEALAATLGNFNQDTFEWLVEYSAHEERNVIVDSEKKRGKTDAAIRTIQVYEPLRSALLEDFQKNPRGYFISNAEQERATSSSFRRSWDQMLLYLEKAANNLDPEKQLPRAISKEKPENWILVDFTPHDLRYTFATFLFDAEVDEKTAQRWMGHTSPEMTRDLYAQLTTERKARSDENLSRYLERFSGLKG